MQVKKLLSLTTTTIYCAIFVQIFLHNHVSNNIFAQTNDAKFSKSNHTTSMDYELWNKYLKDVSARKSSTSKNMLLIKLFSVRMHDILYDSELVDDREKLLYDLVKKIRIQQPSVLALMDLISFHLQIKKGQWSKALRSGIKFSSSRLLLSLSLPNLEYFLYHLNRVSETEKYALDFSLKFSTNRWLVPSNKELKQANVAFFLFQAKFLKLQHQHSVKLDSKFYNSYLNAVLQVSEYGLKTPQLNPWEQLRARKNPRRRRLLHESQGLPPQLTLALLQIKRCTRFANSDFQLYNAHLQQAFLSQLAGRDKQYYESIKDATELHPSPRLYLELASIYKAKKDYLRMHKNNQKALSLDPKITEISGPEPEVSFNRKQSNQETPPEKIISLLSKSLENSQITRKRVHDIVDKIAQLKNSDDFTQQIHLLLEQSIPLHNLGHWVETWTTLYKNLDTSTQNRLQARFLLWLQIMLYSQQSPQQQLSSNTVKTLRKIAQDSILGSSINKCLRSTSPATLHR